MKTKQKLQEVFSELKQIAYYNQNKQISEKVDKIIGYFTCEYLAGEHFENQKHSLEMSAVEICGNVMELAEEYNKILWEEYRMNQIIQEMDRNEDLSSHYNRNDTHSTRSTHTTRIRNLRPRNRIRLRPFRSVPMLPVYTDTNATVHTGRPQNLHDVQLVSGGDIVLSRLFVFSTSIPSSDPRISSESKRNHDGILDSTNPIVNCENNARQMDVQCQNWPIEEAQELLHRLLQLLSYFLFIYLFSCLFGLHRTVDHSNEDYDDANDPDYVPEEDGEEGEDD